MSNVPLEINAAKMAKFVEVEDSEGKRLPFDEEDMKVIFRELFIKDATGISGATLFWMVLLAPFTGCRLDRKSTRLTPVTNAHLVCRLLLERINTFIPYQLLRVTITIT